METNDSSRKVNFENLSKEELIKKCTQLLQLAQKAKLAKSTLQEENNKLKEELNNKSTSNSDPAFEELIENLTQQKLSLVTNNQELKTQNEHFAKKINVYEKELKEFDEKLTICDNENTSYKRQIKRLTDENEQLILDLDALEKQCIKSKEIDLKDQQSLDSQKPKIDENEKAKNELQLMLSVSLEEVKKLKLENSNLMDKIENLQLNLSEKDKNIIVISEELTSINNKYTADLKTLETLKNTQENNNILNNKIKEIESNNEDIKEANTKLKQKLKFYHSKIVKFAGIAKELRQNKKEVLDLFKSYLDQVKEWKEQLNYGEKNIVKYLNNIEMENQHLKQKLESQNHEDSLLDNSNFENELKILTDKFENEKLSLQIELGESKKYQTKFETEKYNLETELKQAHENIKKLIMEIEELKEKITDKNIIEEKCNTELNKLKDDTQKIELEIKEVNLKYDETKNKLEEMENIKINLESDKLNLQQQLQESTEVLKNLNHQIVEFKQKDELLQQMLEEKQQSENDTKNMKTKYNDEIIILKNKLEDIQNINNNLSETLQKYKDENNEKSSDLDDIIKEQENEIKLLRKENVTTSKIKEDLLTELDKLNLERKQIKDKLEEYKSTISDLQNRLRSFEELEMRSTEEIKKLAEENKQLISQNETFQENLQKFEYALANTIPVFTQTNEIPNNNEEYEEQIANLKRENTELLSEMNEMNQAIKERGENISKLEAHCEEVLKKLQIYETQANKNIDNITEKEKIIENLTNEIQELRRNDNSAVNNEIHALQSEIESLKEKLNANGDFNFADNDTMSTSTISRSEDMNRLKDLEGSWEEKYGKLRNLAIKLKGKVRELTQTITQQQTENEELQKKLTSNIKTIQNQYDILQDDLEKSKKECKQLQNQINVAANDISKDKQLLADKEEQLSKMQVELENYKKEKQVTDNWKKQVSAKIQTLRKELEANNVLKKEFEAKIVVLNNTLKTEVESHKHTKNLLDQSNSERKKNSVLSLEMQDYERSAKESTKKLEKQQEEITKLNNQIESQKTTINALREQNKLLEERMSAEEKNLITATSEINTYKKQISNLDNEITQKVEKIHSLTHQLETSRSEIEELSTELSKVIAEHQKINGVLKIERDQLSNENLRLQQNLREAQNTLRLSKDELKLIQNEYDGYKVRAQSVLRQNQNRDVGLEEKLSEEVASLVAQNLVLTNHMDDAKKKIESLESENTKLSIEIKEYVNKIKELEEDSEDVKLQFADLSSKYEKTVTENAETLRNLKIHADTLSQCYRQQLADQETRHNREVVELQSRLEKAPTPTETSPVLPTMPRGEGEGSESIDSNNSTNVHPVPLERLLGTDSDQEVDRIKKKLQEHESKVTHLTALLSDTEQDLVKHVQMNKLLKEEIRRQQRSEEREKHAENLEYLKNVVFKFVTLNSGDERSRLVPVLNTILKLSPEETKELNSVAKGGDLNLKAWSSYLPTWSSPNKPQ